LDPELRAKLDTLAKAHATLPRPSEAGKPVGSRAAR
jgi:hypothetical protein